MDYSEKYLIMVTINNNNKYYKMVVNGDTWTAEYGRVGAGPQKKVYPISEWQKKYDEKIRKGYVDLTDLKQKLITEAPTDEVPYKEVEDRVVQEIVERLCRMAKEVVKANYRVSSDDVTQKMVDTAQRKLNELMFCSDTKQFNDTLLELFTIIPRKMCNVSVFLAGSPSDFNQIIAKEQSLLDTVRGQVRNIPDDKTETSKIERKNITILDDLGLAMESCTSKDIELIKKQLGDNKNQFVDAWRVTNNTTPKKFDQFVKNMMFRKQSFFGMVPEMRIGGTF